MKPLLAFAAGALVSLAAAADPSPYESAKRKFATAGPVDPAFKSQVYLGSLVCSDGAGHPATLVGPQVKTLPVETATGRAVVIAPEDGRGIKQTADETLLELAAPDGARRCYGIFARTAPSTEVRAGIENAKQPLAAGLASLSPGVRVEGQVFADAMVGGMPLGTLGVSAPYQGPRLGGEIARLARYGDDGIVKGLDLRLRGSYTGAFSDASAGLIDLRGTANVWLGRTWNIELGHERAQNRGMPADTPTYKDLGNQVIKATWAGLHFVPTGMEDVNNRIEYFVDIYRIPGHCGGGYEDQCFVGGEKNNTWPARVRGENVPVKGWEAGLRVSRVVADSIRIPFTNVTLREVVLGTHGGLVGGTPFDNAESLNYGASLSAHVTEKWIVGVRGDGMYNLNKEVQPDPKSSRPFSATSRYGIFVVREWK